MTEPRAHDDEPPTDRAGVQETLATIEDEWADTIDALHDVPELLLHERVDGEWSFVQTLRHLVFVNDTWFRRTILGLPRPYHPLAIGPTGIDPAGLGLDLDAAPTYAEVLVARHHRLSRLRQHLDTITDAGLARMCAPNPSPGFPRDTRVTVLHALHRIFHEERAHHRFAVRDLVRLGVLPSGHGPATE